MIDVKRIVCPVDFSDFSRRALDHAIALARWYEARVTVLHVYSAGVPPAVFAPGASTVAEPLVLSAVDRDLLLQELTVFAEAGRGEVPVDVQLAQGTVWREIVSLAEAAPADLLLMGTHGRSGFERLLLGSVTEKILRVAPCPVLTVPPAAPDAVPIAAGLFKRILCPTDFSPAADAALTWATSLAQEADAELIVLHVMEAPVVSELEGFPRSGLAAYRREYEEWTTSRLRAAVPDTARTCCTVREMMSSGTPHLEILRMAGEHQSELIVMGVSGHRGVGDRIFGSTTQHVVRASACPVLTVRGS